MTSREVFVSYDHEGDILRCCGRSERATSLPQTTTGS